MTADIDLTELTTGRVLDLAIGVEEEARERYLELAHQMSVHHTEDAAIFFRQMAELEKYHGDRLRRRRSVVADDDWADLMTHPVEVEAPAYFTVRAFMTVHEAVDVALEAELNAHRFYSDAMARAEDDELRALFENLRDQEDDHRRILERFRTTLAVEDRADPTDYVDEPRAL